MRRLTLTRETVAELTDGELAGVAGGQQLLSGPTCPLLECTEGLPSWYCHLSVPC